MTITLGLVILIFNLTYCSITFIKKKDKKQNESSKKVSLRYKRQQFVPIQYKVSDKLVNLRSNAKSVYKFWWLRDILVCLLLLHVFFHGCVYVFEGESLGNIDWIISSYASILREKHSGWLPEISKAYHIRIVFPGTTYTVWKVSVFKVFLVGVFPHTDWIRRDKWKLTFS